MHFNKCFILLYIEISILIIGISNNGKQLTKYSTDLTQLSTDRTYSPQNKT